MQDRIEDRSKDSSLHRWDENFLKAGAGFLALGANNTYTGDTTISGGKLSVGNNSAGTLGGGIYAGNIFIASSANLRIWSTVNFTNTGVISGAGNLLKAYGGSLTLSTNNTYSGKTSLMPQTTAGFTVNVASFNSVNGRGSNQSLAGFLLCTLPRCFAPSRPPALRPQVSGFRL